MPVFVGGTFAMVVFSHTVQVWLWAVALVWSDAILDWSTAVYFSVVTYTTLGYGDITLGEEHRVFASFASITGLLTFGLSTAFLVGLVTRLMPNFIVSGKDPL
ncbi:ion channel [Falsihalocynthiibacter sp. SS001]|uniref:ion channel n=1 Tax=Falsihalocynthiibacter sp. SS001 TaxID=3349698 RepID=UPI0036D2968C